MTKPVRIWLSFGKGKRAEGEKGVLPGLFSNSFPGGGSGKEPAS